MKSKLFYIILYIIHLLYVDVCIVFSSNYSCPNYIDEVKKDKNFNCLDKYPNSCFSILYRIDCDYYNNGNLERETHRHYEGFGENIKSFKDGLMTEYLENGSKFQECIYDKDKLKKRKIYGNIISGVVSEEYNYKEGSLTPDITRTFFSNTAHKYEKQCPKRVGQIFKEVEDNKAKLLQEDFSSTTFIKNGYLCKYRTGLSSFKDVENKFEDDIGTLESQSQIDGNGVLNGEMRKFYKDLLTSIISYNNGKKNGYGKKFDEKGNMIQIVNFIDDKAVNIKQFNKDSSLFGEAKLNGDEKPLEITMYREKNNTMLKIYFIEDYPSNGICYKKDGGTRKLNEAELIYFTSNNKEFRDCDE